MKNKLAARRASGKEKFFDRVSKVFLLSLTAFLLHRAAYADVTIDQAWLDSLGSSPYYLDQANTRYVLATDVDVPGTAFAVIANNITFDLNGHTITYDNLAPVPVSNGDFEAETGTTITGWIFSTAPNAYVAQGTFVQPATVYSGQNAVRFSIPAADQSFVSTNMVTLAPNTTYDLSFMAYNLASDTASLSVGFQGTTIKAVQTGKTWRGFQYTFVTFTTGSSPASYYLEAGLSGVSTATAGTVYLDDVKIQKHYDHGVILGPRDWAPTRYPEATRYGDAAGSTVMNGTVIQGQGKGNFAHAVYVASLDTYIHDMAITVSGPSSQAIMAGSGAEGAQIYNNVISNNVKTIYIRDHFDGATITLAGNYGERSFIVHDNRIVGGPQIGIAASSTSSQIYNNTISLKTLYTNDFAIELWADRGSDIHHNAIDCTSNSDFSCRGIYAGGNTNNTQIHDNTISVRELPRNQEYDGCSLGGGYGIQIESAVNVEVYGNTATAEAATCQAAAFRTNPETALGPINVHDNFFNAVQAGTAKAYTCKFSELNGATTSFIFKNNVLTTNSAWIIGSGALNVVMEGNTFQTQGTLPQPFRPFDTSDWRRDPTTSFTENRFLNNQYPDTATKDLFESASFYNTYGNVIDPVASFYVSWKIAVSAVDSNNQPIANASVVATNGLGTQVFSGVTDASGMASFVADQFKNTAGVITQLNPYAIQVSNGADTLIQTVTVTAPQTVVFNFGGAVVLPPNITSQPSDITVTEGQTATFSVTATGTDPLSYQWQKNGADISSATSSSYTTPAATLSDNGSTFRCVVSNVSGSVTSNSATLTVNALPPPPPPGDTTPPVISLSGPSTVTTKNVKYVASVSDNVGVTQVEFYLNGVLKTTDTSSPYVYTLNARQLARGTHTVMARAYDAANNSASASMTITKS